MHLTEGMYVLRCLHGYHDMSQAGAGGHAAWSLEPVNHEGHRVNVDEGEGRRGWLLLRQSLHDPLLVLNIESDTQGGEGQRLVANRYLTWGLPVAFTMGVALSSLRSLYVGLYLSKSGQHVVVYYTLYLLRLACEKHSMGCSG